VCVCVCEKFDGLSLCQHNKSGEQVMDWDRFSADETIGECRIKMEDIVGMIGKPLSLQIVQPVRSDEE